MTDGQMVIGSVIPIGGVNNMPSPCPWPRYDHSINGVDIGSDPRVDQLQGIVQALAEQVSIMRGVMWGMLQQASMDEVDQTPAGNPWLALKKQAAKLINPSILKLNNLLGIKAEAQPEKQKALVIATEGPAGGNIAVPSTIARA